MRGRRAAREATTQLAGAVEGGECFGLCGCEVEAEGGSIEEGGEGPVRIFFALARDPANGAA
jgi:hypothetical protein